MFMLLNLNNAFCACTVEGWKRFQSFSSFPCGRAKRYENDRVDAILSLRFQWNENANFWKRIRVDGALMYTKAVNSQRQKKINFSFNCQNSAEKVITRARIFSFANEWIVLNNYSPKWRWIAVESRRIEMKIHRYSSTQVNDCVSIYQTSE